MKLILEIYWSSGGDIEDISGTDYYAIEEESVKQAEEDLFALAYACAVRYLKIQEDYGWPGAEYEVFHFHKIPLDWKNLFYFKKNDRYKRTNIECWHYLAPKIFTLDDWFEHQKESQ